MEPAPTLAAMVVASARRVVVLLAALAMGACAWGLGTWAMRSPLRPASTQRVLDDLLARGAAGLSALILAWWAVGVLGYLVLSLRPASRSSLLRAVASSLPSPLRAVTTAALGAVVATSVAVPASAAGPPGFMTETTPTAPPAAAVAWTPSITRELTGTEVAWAGANRTAHPSAPTAVGEPSRRAVDTGATDPAWAALGTAELPAATVPTSGDGTPGAEAAIATPPATGSADVTQTSEAGAVDRSQADDRTPSMGRATHPGSTVTARDAAPGDEDVPARPVVATGTAETASGPAVTTPSPAHGPGVEVTAAVDPSWTPSRPPSVRAATAASPLVVPTPRQTVAATSEVVVRAGDTLWDLCARHLPPGATDAEIAVEWPRWFEANRDVLGPDPDHIEPGQRLQPPGPTRT